MTPAAKTWTTLAVTTLIASAAHTQAMAPVLASIVARRLHHAHLWTGPEGVGKYLWARRFAKAALCLEQREAEAECGCLSCKNLDSHADFITLGPAPQDLKIEGVRALLHQCAMKPMLSERRVVVVRDMHAMTPQAQNAFLKTLEEPPGQTVFVLLTHLERRLLRTIRSRCQQVRFAPLGRAELEQLAAPKLAGLDPKVASSVLDAASGSMAQLQRLLDTLGEGDSGPLGGSLSGLLKAPLRDRLVAAEALAESLESTQVAAIRLAHQLAAWGRTGNDGQRKIAGQLLIDLNDLVAKAEGNGNRKLLWERWLMSV